MPEDKYQMAVALAREYNSGSTSFLQRKMALSYNEAAALIERMEEEGIVSEPNFTGRREVLPRGGEGV
jgi:DNA segregation ATPase FtsK/SpoIIIE, S-DNA-T family